MAWLFCRWHFQKSAAAEMDSLQNHISIIARATHLAQESLRDWFKQSKHVGQDFASKESVSMELSLGEKSVFLG